MQEGRQSPKDLISQLIGSITTSLGVNSQFHKFVFESYFLGIDIDSGEDSISKKNLKVKKNKKYKNNSDDDEDYQAISGTSVYPHCNNNSKSHICTTLGDEICKFQRSIFTFVSLGN